MTELIKLTQEQHEFIQTFNIGVQTDLDLIDKQKAIHYISRWGFGFALRDGKEVEYSFVQPINEVRLAPFDQDERLKIIDAIINGYEVIEPRYHLFSRPYNEVTDAIEKVYFLGEPYRLRSTTGDEELKQDWGKTYSLDEAEKIQADFDKLGVFLELEEVK